MKIRPIIICAAFAAIGLWWWDRSSLPVEEVADMPKAHTGKPVVTAAPVESAGTYLNSPAPRKETGEIPTPQKPDPRTELSSAIKDMIARLKVGDAPSVVEHFDPHIVAGEFIPPEINYRQGMQQLIASQSRNLIDVLDLISGKTPVMQNEAEVEIATFGITDPVTGRTAMFHLRKVNGIWCYDLNDIVGWQREMEHPELR